MAKKRDADGAETEVAFDQPDMTKVSPEFDIKALLAGYGTKKEEASKRKVSLHERVQKNMEAISRIQTLIANLRAKAQAESGQVFVDSVVRPLAAEMQNLFGNATVEVTGPFGLGSAATVTVAKKGLSAANKLKGVDTRTVTLVPTGENGIAVRNVEEDTGEYENKASLGFQQGLSHPLVNVPTDGSALEFILSWLR